MIEPTSSARAQVIAAVAAQPGASSGEIGQTLPDIERKTLCAHLAGLVKRGALERHKPDGVWRYHIAAGTKPTAADLSDDDDGPAATDTPTAAARITTHHAEAPRRPGRVTAAEAARRKASDAPEAGADVDTAEPVVDTTTIADATITTEKRDHALDGALGSGITFRPRYDGVGDAIRVAIDDEGSLSIDSADVFLRLGPAHTRQLAEFLACTIAIWSRP